MKRTRKKSDPNPCSCIVTVNKELESKKLQVHVMMTLSGRIFPVVATVSEKSGRLTSKPSLAASFCPFCGVDLRV